MRMSEEGSLCSHGKDEFIPTVRLHFAYLTNQVDCVCPAQMLWQFSGKKARVEKVKIVAKKCTHLFSMALARTQDCIALLTSLCTS